MRPAASSPDDRPPHPLQHAAYLVTTERFATPAFLVRHMRIPVSEAQQLLDQLEERHIIGPPTTGSRDVLIEGPHQLPAPLRGGATPNRRRPAQAEATANDRLGADNPRPPPATQPAPERPDP